MIGSQVAPVYPEPFKFNLDRFMKDERLDQNVRDPGRTVLGFGRRYSIPNHTCMNVIAVDEILGVAIF